MLSFIFNDNMTQLKKILVLYHQLPMLNIDLILQWLPLYCSCVFGAEEILQK